MDERLPPLSDDARNRRDRAILALLSDGWQHDRPYRKWAGAHWRLLSLCELGIRRDPRTAPMMDAVLEWLTGARHRNAIVTIEGRVRRCASQEGNALLAASLLGYADDQRAQTLARNLVSWQWPDGGWNCDRRPEAAHSSFHETLPPLRGLAVYADAVDDPAARRAADLAGEFLLAHELVRSHTTGRVIDREWLRIHWPAYWHYDVLQGLRGIHAVGQLDRPQAVEALDWLEQQRHDDGHWHRSGRRYWRPPGSGRSQVDVVDWTDLDAALITQQAQAILHAAGRGDVTA